MAPIPEIALRLIGPHKFVSKHDFAEGYGNNVWRVYCDDWEDYVVKRFRSHWAKENETRALEYLKQQCLPSPRLYAKTETIHIYHDDRGEAPERINTRNARDAGRFLAEFHKGEINSPVSEPSAYFALHRAIEAASAHYRPGLPCVPVHGDLCPGNILMRRDGSLQHFIDFEEFHLGDPVADLLQAMLEFTVSGLDQSGQTAENVLRSMLDGYQELASGDKQIGKVSTILAEPKARLALANSLYDGQIAWARSETDSEKLSLYEKRRPAIFSALETFLIN